MQQDLTIEKLSPAAQHVIDRYTTLTLGSKTVRTPYFMNRKGKKAHRVHVGKGAVHEIEAVTQRLAKQEHFNLGTASSEEIRQFMIDHEIGIDCSGFVSWILQSLVHERSGKNLWDVLDFRLHPLKAHVVKRLRPIENISVKVLTHPANSSVIANLRDVRPGDMVRTLDGGHILLITEVARDKDNGPVYFKYINSTEYEMEKYGIREGIITITKPDGTILDQPWQDLDGSQNLTYEAAKEFPKTTEIVRLKALAF